MWGSFPFQNNKPLKGKIICGGVSYVPQAKARRPHIQPGEPAAGGSAQPAGQPGGAAAAAGTGSAADPGSPYDRRHTGNLHAEKRQGISGRKYTRGNGAVCPRAVHGAEAKQPPARTG
ncbi:hypothetical protein DW816_04690 [Faecalibacterium prausnitzii]|nr:hypothetical protein DW816_04690 [Faecalibacterium prausnitzii]